MDIYCRKCGEPWDNDEIHEVAEEYAAKPRHPGVTVGDVLAVAKPSGRSTGRTYDAVAADFRRRGCVALGGTCGEGLEERDSFYGLTRAEAVSALYDVLGDDMDAAASMMEDLSF